MNESILADALTGSLSIPMKWLSLAGSTAIYNKMTKIITFKMESKSNKRLNKTSFAQILQLPLEVSFEVPTDEQGLQMFS